jgi:FKBP-type peptidyl-prolyl cis-trans isomerase 2
MKWIFALFLVLLVACTTAERDDKLFITYTGAYTNGTVFDTNDPAYIGEFSAPVSKFTPLEITLGRRQLIKGFEDALYGMREGETKEVHIKALDAYGAYNAELRISVPKKITSSATIRIPREVHVLKGDVPTEIVIGKEIDSPNFRYNMTGVNDTHVFLYALNAKHNSLQLEGAVWNSTIIETTPDYFVFRHNITENQTYYTSQGPYTARLLGERIELTTIFEVGDEFQSVTGTGRIISETGDSITVDFNHPLAGHDLVFDIKIEEIQRP